MKTLLIPVAAVFALVLAGCGSSDAATSAATPAVPATVTVTARAAPAPTVTVTAEPMAAPTVTVRSTIEVTIKPKPAPTVTVTVTTKPESDGSGDGNGDSAGLDPHFGTCGEANDAGYGPYTEGVDPEYDWYTDRDGDGVDCGHDPLTGVAFRS